METTATRKTALILGITGGFGSAVANSLAARGWQVRALHRNPEAGLAMLPAYDIEWRLGDAMNQVDVCAAAQGVDLIVHGLNPPKYQRWRELAIPMLANSIVAAKASGARLVFPGNVYLYGDDAGDVVNENSPRNPITEKGKIRLEMEQMIAEGARHGARAIIVRAGDFFGPGGQTSSWFGSAMIKPGKPVRSVIYPGQPEIAHGWAFLPDVAETVARLAELEADLPDIEIYHFGGHWLASASAMMAAIQRVVGRKVPLRTLPWPLMKLLTPFSGLMRELMEMRYLWQKPLRLDNSKLLRVLGEEPHTPLDEAMRITLIGLGCTPSH
ncbi:NAD-dependent epimerase/dehydratase family protein [Solimicrobium silvestre]|uniref:Nucleoside-diphosphate-sugar epimerase n=1 Tax=Solimicrobium silvestre TaxID=2099400 RepID=A0A2S9H3Z1_9BURK|nr:NAD-dependent epimerase/dehydratase family protein [Solimicrobium silvestre]PRC94699.1 Nucleoside-diphosphate-sugar epimerase [Solimicrobium silvestre]